MLDHIRQCITNYKAQNLPVNLPEAAVLIAITLDEDSPKIIFTKRSHNLSIHRGEVSFPGGKYDVGDESLKATVLRESQEEIGISIEDITLLGRMDQVVSHFGIKVTPFVGFIPKDTVFYGNEEELESIFQVPLKWFVNQTVELETLKNDLAEYQAPSYVYEDYKIWGLTALMLTTFLNVTLDANIPTSYSTCQ